jgi:CheY-like chemotaxis protein
MEYKKFIQALEQCATLRLKPLSLPASCSLSRVPEAFSCTLSSIVAVLDANIDKICKNDEQSVAVFSLQPVSAICDLKPNPNRIINLENPEHHFCCSLGYLLQQKKTEKIYASSWSDSLNIIIDFTTGEIMDNECYFNKMKISKNPGVVYGNIDESQLIIAWNIFNKKSNGFPYGLMNTNADKPKKILVADDDKVIQMLYKHMLTENNLHALSFANNGLEAVKKCAKSCFSAIFMDINMPLMGGIEATQIIREKLKQVPIIGVTANVNAAIKSECLEAGMNLVMDKPFWKSALLKTLNQLNC